ncbi:unnamed protein product [Spirodela intermedia]|uniref:Uncharacterized protein n=1 Tax=Spirodela intermedia TaxID=51605 RepID=A0A7I8K4T2_SPIIN|nr:unnamed protein product [Spirodela intermedia]
MWRKPKKADAVPKLILEEVIGLTTKNASGFSSDPSTSRCAYLAGCVVVLYDVGLDARTHLMVSSRVPKPFSCVALARQGRGFVAAGESGQAPAILLWDFSTGSLLSELKGHQYGVQSIDFSADGKTLVSLGLHNDGFICLWDWKSGKLSAKIKASTTFCPLLSVSFLSEGGSFVTVGKKHLKLWSVRSLKSMSISVGKESLLVDGKPANLGCHKSSSFVSVVSTACTTKSDGGDYSSDSFSIYALTETGLLCAIDHGFSIGKCVDMEVRRGYSLSVSNDLIACACNSGTVQLFQVGSLLYVGNVKYGEPTAYFGLKNLIYQAQPSETLPEHDDAVPDAIACQFLSPTRLGVIYADHSFYIWDIDHIQKVSRCCILVAHSACIWDIKSLPFKDWDMTASTYTDNSSCHEVSFATCSADGTIRQWDLELLDHPKCSHEQRELIANQQMCSALDDHPFSVQLVSCGILEHGNADIEPHGQGFRSMAVSSDGQYLAAGDCGGNLHIFNLQTSTYTCIKEAHRAEILTVNFSKKKIGDNGELKSQHLVTGSKDRMIHVYDVQRNFDLVETLDDHSAPVTSVILTSDDCKLISCGADRCIYFRDVLMTDTGCRVMRRHNQLSSHGAIYDMAIEPADKIAITVGQDKKINKYNLSTGKLVGTFKEDVELGQPVKVMLDPTGSYLVCSYSNKSLRIYDFVTGETVAQAMGHAEVITGSIFLPGCKHMISVSGDSCIFIWKLPALLSSKMLQKVKGNADHLPQAILPQSTSSLDATKNTVESGEHNINFDCVSEGGIAHKEDHGVPAVDHTEDSTFEFSISRLPKWARTKVTSKPILTQAKLLLKWSHIENLCLVQFLRCMISPQPLNLLWKGLLVEESNGNKVVVEVSLNIKSEEPSTMRGLVHPDKAATGVESTSREQEVNRTGEKDEASAKNATACCEVAAEKALNWNADATRQHAFSLTAEVGNSVDETVSDDPFSQKSTNLSPTLEGEESGIELPPSPSPLIDSSKIPHFDDSNPLIRRDQRPGPSEGNGMEDISEFRAALDHLDMAAEAAVSLCTRLGVQQSRGQASESLRGELLRVLETSLPSISERMETLTSIVGGGRVSPGSQIKQEALELGPIVERFAGSLSDRVLELLKNKI